MFRFRHSLAPWLVLALAAAAAAQPADWPPEAGAVLGRFVGEWEIETWIRHEGPPVRESHTRGRAQARRTLGGRYLEFRSASVPAAYEELQVMTYEPTPGGFRQWVFDSDGYRHAAEGVWDAGAQRLVWQGSDRAGRFIIQDHWVSPDRLEWTLERFNAEGQRVQSIRGVVARRRSP
ncbi:MAG: hypothetical protein AB7V27_18180 [Candidatus Binatia bacterium]